MTIELIQKIVEGKPKLKSIKIKQADKGLVAKIKFIMYKETADEIHNGEKEDIEESLNLRFVKAKGDILHFYRLIEKVKFQLEERQLLE